MRRRDLVLIITILVCVIGALGTLTLIQMEAAGRSERNVRLICEKLQRIDGEPCQLEQPSDTGTRLFAFIRRAEGAGPKAPRVAHVEDCTVAVSTNNVYHTVNSPYRSQLKIVPERCYPTIIAAKAAGARAPG